MTRKDYIAMAEAFEQQLRNRRNRSDGYESEAGIEGFEHAVTVLANVLASDNPRFDRSKFLAAAGVQS